MRGRSPSLGGQMAVATFVTGGLASSRSLMAQLTSPTMLSEFFGLYSMSGTATSFAGPLAIALVTAFSHSQRAGFAGAVIVLAVGLVVLFGVPEPPAAPLSPRPHE